METASELDDPVDQYTTIHLAALSGAAAVLAAAPLTRHERKAGRIRSAWDLLPEVAPDLEEFASYFADTAAKRARAEAGIRGAVDMRDLEDLHRVTTLFLRRIESLDMVNDSAVRRETARGLGAAALRRSG